MFSSSNKINKINLLCLNFFRIVQTGYGDHGSVEAIILWTFSTSDGVIDNFLAFLFPFMILIGDVFACDVLTVSKELKL